MNASYDPLVLGIETSCDETSVALYSKRHAVASHKTFTQIPIHEQFGGVIPDVASRNQLEKIHIVTQEVFKHVSIKLHEIDAVAVTTHPGLPGSLAVGIAFAKGIAFAAQKKLIGVNHLEGHMFSPFLEHDIPFPHLCITASGGHTSIHYIEDFGVYHLINYTLDDAAGEAFDKIAKLMNLPYPGGPIIEKLAAQVNFEDFFYFPRSKQSNEFFSFSGIKTAVLYTLIRIGAYDQEKRVFLKNDDLDLKRKVASSLLCCITDVFVQKLSRSLEKYPKSKAITFAGGVACNAYIRSKITDLAQKHNLPMFVPSQKYCTDNGAMIAYVGHYKAQRNQFDTFELDRP